MFGIWYLNARQHLLVLGLADNVMLSDRCPVRGVFFVRLPVSGSFRWLTGLTFVYCGLHKSSVGDAYTQRDFLRCQKGGGWKSAIKVRR